MKHYRIFSFILLFICAAFGQSCSISFSGREVLDMNTDWAFYRGDVVEGSRTDLDDSGWIPVALPHIMQLEMKHCGGNSIYDGVGWYRRYFKLPAKYKDKRVIVSFEGMMTNCDVYLNGQKVTEHHGGYMGFVADLTDRIDWNGNNVLAVRVSAEPDPLTPPGKPQDKMDFYYYSGIYRDVRMVITDKVYITDPLEEDLVAGGGQFVTYPEVTKDKARAHLATHVRNLTDKDQTLSVFSQLVDSAGHVIAEAETPVTLHKQSDRTVEQDLIVNQPALWHPYTPNLYTLRTQLLSEDKVLDETTRKIGIRTIRYTAEEGFFINGEKLYMRGANRHQAFANVGDAASNSMQVRDVIDLKRGGYNAVRAAHYPNDPAFLEACDRYGLLVVECIPGWQFYNPDSTFIKRLYEIGRQMIRRDRNHPSIIMWSIGNEVEQRADEPEGDLISKRLVNTVRKYDTSRFTTIGSNDFWDRRQFSWDKDSYRIFKNLDVAGYNYKEQYYEADHRDFPQIPFLGSENGHSYEAWDAVKSNDYISGQFLWTGIDYLGEAHGWPIHGSGAGILDCAGFEKARYFRRKSLWCEEPQLYLATRLWSEESAEWIPCQENWNYKAGEKVIVMCYSNLPETAVFINGKEAGRQIGYNDDGAYRFEVLWEAGILEASGYDENGNIIEQERLLTTQNAAGIKAEVYQPEKIHFSETQENGYLYQVALTLVDQNGQKVVWDDRKLRVAVSGAGMLAGIENGDLSDVTPYAENMRKTKDGRLMIYVRRIKKGKIRVEISETDSIAEISTITEKNRITGKTGIAEKDSTEEKGGMHLEVEMD